MTHLRWQCAACKHAEETPQDVLLTRLRGAGLLRRVEAEEAKDMNYLLEIAKSAGDRIPCPACGTAGYVPQSISDDTAGWPESRKCSRCGREISVERLEVFPGTTLCPACQQASEQGASGGEEDYCPRCGTPMKVRQRRGRGVAAYELACPSCGERSR
jgi:DNA-directed RNA polymerase subunit M/transcription elongation factor TFIIS